MSPADEAAITAQLQRPPRGVAGVAWRCPCGNPGVVATLPRLPDGTPFPTTYYLTCPRATAATSTLEAQGLMAEMSERLGEDPDLAERYRRAHEAYLADRAELDSVAEIDGISAGGMPTRVKCLHVLVGHSLAVGAGVNPLGDVAVEALGEFWRRPCLDSDRPLRVAVVDCGTNALRMLVLQDAGKGGAIEVVRRLRLVRLGERVDSTGEFTAAALARTFAALDEYARELTELNVQRVRFVATSAARDAGNVTEFLAGVHARLGVAGEIISGAEEARLSFAGALTGVAAPSEPVLVTDIGGGSTELVVGTHRGVQRAVSLDIGSVRLRERFLADDPPSAAQLAAAAAYIDSQLAGAGIDLAGTRGWIGVAGTVTTMAALAQGLVTYDRRLVQGARLDRAAIDAVTDQLCSTRVADLVSELLPPLRAEVIAAGALICARIAGRVGADEMIVSETDILDGVARELLDDSAAGVGFAHQPP